MKLLIQSVKSLVKPFFLGIFCALFCSYTNNLFGQCTESITLRFQEDIDNFMTDYGCSEIEGDLKIEEQYLGSITNLAGLSGLTSINGALIIDDNAALINVDDLQNLISINSLKIERNDALINLDGLQNISTVINDLSIYYNASLTNLNGLQNIFANTTINGDIDIAYNDALMNIDGLQNLSTIDGNLWIHDNAALLNIDGLQNLSTVAGDLMIGDVQSLPNLNVLQNLATIEGDLTIENNPILTNIDALQTTNIMGGLDIDNNDALINVDGLQNMNAISGSLIIENNDALPNLDGLQNVNVIGGSLMIKNNDALPNLDALQNVFTIDSNLIINENDVLLNLDGLQNVSSISGTLSIYNNISLSNIDGLQNVSFISGDLYIDSNEALPNLDGLQNVTTIGGGFFLYSSFVLTNIDGLQNLTSIGGSLEIDWNDALLDIDGLQNVTSIGGDLWIGYCYILDLDGLQNVTSIGGNLWFWYLGIDNIDGLQNLSSIGGDLTLWDVSIDNIDGLQNLTSIGGDLKITEMYSLSNLDGLQNVISFSGNIEIYDNSMLNVCCSVINLLDGIEGEIDIYDNLTNCNSIGEIISYCIETAEEIYVSSFFDENENGIFDENEQTMSESFNLEPSALYAFSNGEGVGHFILEDYGVYQLSINNLHPLWTINGEETIQLDYLDYTFIDTIHYFPMIPVADFVIQNIDLTSSITRCNQETNYWLTYTNEGTTINSGYVQLIADELTDFVSANPPVDSIAGDTLYWFYENLYPYNSNQIHLVYEMPGVAEFGEEIIGEEITFEVSVQVETEAGVKIGKKILSSELVCAYDPNDKLVTPSGYGSENYTLFGDTLEYTIRFQNTGNDTAFTVVIEDELSAFLDLNTFQPISSSHDLRTQIDLETRIATFAFNDIYLPDSFVNEVASHGFVKYRVLGNEGLDENTQIENTASIFFDSNPAIVTNTVSNEMVSVLPTLPIISASPNELNFGEIVLEDSDYLTQTLVINNTGDLPLEIQSFDFANAVFNSGEIETATIEGQNSLEIPIYFAPDEVGVYESELTLQSNVGSLSVALNGTAVLNTGIEDLSKTEIKVFPNPNEGRFYLDASNERVLSYQIQNILGDVILIENAVTDFNLIDMQKQSKGIYFLNIETKDGIFVEKIVVQ